MSFAIQSTFQQVLDIYEELRFSLAMSTHSRLVPIYAEKLKDIIEQNLPALIDDVVRYPQHEKAWRNLCVNPERLEKLAPGTNAVIQKAAAKIIKANSPENFADLSIAMIGSELSARLDLLKDSPTQDEIAGSLKSVARIFLIFFKFFRGINGSGKPLTIDQNRRLSNSVYDFKSGLRFLKDTSPEVASHEFFPKLEKLAFQRIGFLGLQYWTQKFPSALIGNIVKFLPHEKRSIPILLNAVDLKKEEGINAIARWIDYNKIPLAFVVSNFGPEILRVLRLHLRYVNLLNFDFSILKPLFRHADSSAINLTSRSENDIHEFIQNCPNIKTLIIKTDLITSLPARISQLESLNCQKCTKLKNLPKQMNKLLFLNCSQTNIKQLPDVMNSLKYLNCDNTKITKLSSKMDNLEKLDCCNTHITEISSILPKLEYLDCHECTYLTHLPAGMVSLLELDCSECDSLTTLANDMKSLLKLFCDLCDKLTALPDNMESLLTLTCRDGSVTTLGKGMRHLRYLDAGSSDLISLPSDLDSLRELDCRFTGITVLPDNLHSLRKLCCIGLGITLPTGMTSLRVLALTAIPSSGLPLDMDSLKILHVINREDLPLKYRNCILSKEKGSLFNFDGWDEDGN